MVKLRKRGGNCISVANVTALAFSFVSLTFCYSLYIDLGWESSSVFDAVVDDPICERLTEWILKNGGEISGTLCVNRPEAGGRGIIASRQLKSNEAYLKLPRHLWFYRDWIQANSSIRNVIDQDPTVRSACGQDWSTGETCRVILALEYEKHQANTFWKPYFDTFPERPTSLIWWSDSQLKELQSPILLEETEASWEWINESYARLFPYLTQKYPLHFPPNIHTHDSWAKSVVHVWARAFACTSDKQHVGPKSYHRRKAVRASGLMPYADLVNHQSYVDGPYSADFEPGQFVVKAAECYTKGAELYHSYGSHHSSHHFLSTYGFVPNGHLQADYIALLIPEGKTALTNERRKSIVAAKGQHVGFIGVDGIIYPEEFLLNYARVTQMPDVSIKDFYRDYDETSTLKSILTQVQSTLESFPSTLEEDLDDVERGFTTYEGWAALMARTRFKRVFDGAVTSISFRIENGEYPEYSQEWQQNYEVEFEKAKMYDTAVGMSLFRLQLHNDL